MSLPLSLQLSNEEKPAISVSDLKLRFENNSLPYYEPKANQEVPIGEVCGVNIIMIIASYDNNN